MGSAVSWVSTFLLAVVTSVVASIVYAWLVRPSLQIQVPEPLPLPFGDGAPAEHGVFVRLMVEQRPVIWGLRWFLSRQAAQQCLVRLSFYDLAGQMLFGGPVVGRWSGSSQPILPKIYRISKGMNESALAGVILDVNQQQAFPFMTIYPDIPEAVDVAAQFDDDTECFVWNNENYFSRPPWRHPDRKLGVGTYLGRVDVYIVGRRFSQVFRLVNCGQRQSLSLTAGYPSDARTLNIVSFADIVLGMAGRYGFVTLRLALATLLGLSVVWAAAVCITLPAYWSITGRVLVGALLGVTWTASMAAAVILFRISGACDKE